MKVLKYIVSLYNLFPLGRLRWTLILITKFALLNTASAQNLVLNPSFEDTIKTPKPSAPLLDSFAYNWTRPINHDGSADYFHVLASSALGNQGYQIPQNTYGIQDTCHKNAYTGIASYWKFISPSQGNYREYIVGELLNKLDSNTCYKVTFKYSVAEKISRYGIKGFGVYFTDSIPIAPLIGGDNLNYQPQIEINQYLYDTENWVKIERFYLAQGREKHITLGNFNSNDDTDTILIQNISNPLNPDLYSTYIYLDDIHVEEVPLHSLPQLNLGSDTVLCEGEELTFRDLLPDSTVYVWNQLSNDTAFTIDSTGLYTLEAYNGCSYTTDSIYVEFVEPIVELGNDKLVCKREEIVLQNTNQSTDHPQTEFLWNSGDTTAQLQVTEEGIYSLKAEIGHCQDADTVEVTYKAPKNSELITHNLDTIFCVSGFLDAGSTTWNDTYLWNTEEEAQSIEVTESGNYSVYAENECTEATSTFNVKVEQLEEGLNNYNVFSPNGDFINDNFTIYEGNSEEYQIQIYNRWGKLVFESDDPEEHWSAEGVSDGSYFYQLTFRNCAGENIEKKGTVEVRR